jgi:hypothetical protein
VQAKLLALANALSAVAAASAADNAVFRELADPYFETVGLARENQVDRGARQAFALTLDGAGSLKVVLDELSWQPERGARCRSPADEQRDRVALRAAMKKAVRQ